MSESFPKTLLWLIAGLAVGTGGGYFWGADSALAPAAIPPQPATAVAEINPSQGNGNATGIAAAISNPTGLQLVGTLVQADHSRSKAWLLQAGSETTQTYAEGDLLPGGYQLISIGAEDLQVTKDGYRFVIRRTSSSSGQNSNAPCETTTPASHDTRTNAPKHLNPSERRGGTMGRHVNSAANQTMSQGTQPAQKSGKVSKGWGNKMPVEDGESLVDENTPDDSPEPSNNKDPLQ